jgi:hypothetical protein
MWVGAYVPGRKDPELTVVDGRSRCNGVTVAKVTNVWKSLANLPWTRAME